MAVIGIDLGTTNSLCVTYRNGQEELIPNMFNEYLTPSVVNIKNNEVIVGKIAKEKLVTDPKNTASLFKRAMGTNKKYKLDNNTYSPEQLSSFVVKQLIEDAKNYLQEEIDEVVISVPAYFNAKQRRATKAIGNILGIKIERLINEPSAAAISCHELDEYETFVVFDLGGGTLDVSVVDCFENVVSITSICGNNHLGGIDFDQAIAYYFCAQNNLIFENLPNPVKSSILLASERAKIYLTDHEQTEINLSIDHKNYSSVLTKAKLYDICLPVLENAKTVIAKAVKDSGFTADEIDSIILVGGSSKMPTVHEYLSNLLSVPINYTNEMDVVVAKGLGKYIGIKQRNDNIKDMVVTDICPFSLSTAIVNKVQPDKLLSKVVINRNTVLPTSKTVNLATAYLGQDEISIDIYQGESMYAKDNLLLGATTVKIPVNKEQHEQISLTYTYDINSMLYVEILICSTNQKYVLQIGEENNLVKVANENAINTIKNISLQLNKNPEYEMTIERIERIFTELDPQRQDILREYAQSFIKRYEYNVNNLKKKAQLIHNMNLYLDQIDVGAMYENMDIFRINDYDDDDDSGDFS